MAGPRKKAAGADAPAEAAAGEEAKIDTRGALVLELGGTDYTLRPSHTAVQAIEQKLDRSLFELANAAARGSLKNDEMGVIAAEMMRAQGRTMSDGEPNALGHKQAKPERVAEMIYEEGGPKICTRLMVVLVGAVNGGYTAQGEAKAGTETT